MSTKIQWATDSWNPIAAYDRETGKRGWFCTKVSPGCTNCYAEKFNQFRGNGHLYRVGNLDKVRFELAPTLTKPLHWRKQRRVFVNSMTDLFLDAHTDEMIDQVIGVIAALRAWAMPHQFLVLTKRPERQRDYFADPATRERVAKIAAHHTDDANADNVWDGLMSEWWPLSNLWLGVSVENQAAADERIPILLDTPAAVRFLSCEPLLGRLKFPLPCIGSRFWSDLHWIIVGGESGSHARPCDVAWIRSIVARCAEAQVPCFVKQMGKWITGDHTGRGRTGFDTGFVVNRWLFEDGSVFVPPVIGANAHDRPANAIAFGNCDTHGGNWIEWPADLRVREFPAEVGA